MSKDKRLWFRQDAAYLSNPKVSELLPDHPFAVLLHIECIGYSKLHNTDGVVPVRTAMRIACASHDDLDAAISVGLLERIDDRRVRVHDYLEHQDGSDKANQLSQAGTAAAKARWHANRNADRMRIASEPDSESHENRNAREEKRREEVKDLSAGADRFDDFWDTYPSRAPHSNPKKTARDKFKAACEKTDPDTIIAAAAAYARLRAGQDPQHTAMAATWLNQERWNDDTTPAPVYDPDAWLRSS